MSSMHHWRAGAFLYKINLGIGVWMASGLKLELDLKLDLGIGVLHHERTKEI